MCCSRILSPETKQYPRLHTMCLRHE